MVDPPRAPDDDIPEAVRRRCAEIVETARWVTLDADRLAAYAAGLVTSGEVDPAGGEDDPWAVTGADDEVRAGLVLALAAVNFGSGYHPVVRKRRGLSGARTMAAGLRDWAAATPPTALRLAHLTPAEAHRIFGQPTDDEDVAELMGLFAAALNDLGNLVLDEHDGSFVALVDSAGGKAVALVSSLDRLPFFRDAAPYRGRVVPFYKRAQLAAADLHRAFGGRGPAAFDDLDRLTAFADNLVPHVLRVDGVLRYDAELAERIDAGELLAAGCEEEVEIRAAGVHAVELLATAVADGAGAGRDRGPGRPRPCDLDAVLWWRGRQPRYKAVPRHRTRTTSY